MPTVVPIDPVQAFNVLATQSGQNPAQQIGQQVGDAFGADLESGQGSPDQPPPTQPARQVPNWRAARQTVQPSPAGGQEPISSGPTAAGQNEVAGGDQKPDEAWGNNPPGDIADMEKWNVQQGQYDANREQAMERTGMNPLPSRAGAGAVQSARRDQAMTQLQLAADQGTISPEVAQQARTMLGAGQTPRFIPMPDGTLGIAPGPGQLTPYQQQMMAARNQQQQFAQQWRGYQGRVQQARAAVQQAQAQVTAGGRFAPDAPQRQENLNAAYKNLSDVMAAMPNLQGAQGMTRGTPRSKLKEFVQRAKAGQKGQYNPTAAAAAARQFALQEGYDPDNIVDDQQGENQ